MKRTFVLWIAAFVITSASAVYQRVTGPTYPLKGEVDLKGKILPYTLERSHGGESNHVVQIATGDETIRGFVEWKRHNTTDPWTIVPMSFQDGRLSAELPLQPPAGKLAYRVILESGDRRLQLPDGRPAVLRFKGDVPAVVLILHIVAMFGGMLFSARAGIECFLRQPQFKALTVWTLLLLGFGGMILGPVVQHYAFGAYWTGWPFGSDLTDNKTALAFLGWIFAAVALRRSRAPRRWVLAASVITLVAFLIPHSLFGSELEVQNEPQRMIVSFR